MTQYASSKHIDHLIKNKSNRLKNLLGRLEEIDRLNNEFLTYLEPNMRKQCFVVNIMRTQLVLMTANSAIATKLRFQSADILTSLRKNPALKHICHLRIKVSPSLAQPMHRIHQPEKMQKVTPLSPEAAHVILEMANTLEDKKLSEIMKRIAGRAFPIKVKAENKEAESELI